MKHTSVIAAGALLASVASAAPFGNLLKRDVQWVTKTKDVVFTEIAWATKWVEWQSPAATVKATSTPAAVKPTPVATIIATSTPAAKVAPTTTAIVHAASSTQAAAATTTQAAAAAATTTPTSATSANGVTAGPAADGTTYTGDITYFADGLGSCGITNGPDDHIVAISHILMDNADYYTANPNVNPLCNKQVIIQYAGNSFPATVVDRCTGCSQGDLDLSEGFFSVVTNGDIAAGRISGVTWSWA